MQLGRDSTRGLPDHTFSHPDVGACLKPGPRDFRKIDW